MRRTLQQVERDEYGKARPCKIGTAPALVILDGRYKLAVGKRIRYRLPTEKYSWTEAKVERINPDGYFFASK